MMLIHALRQLISLYSPNILTVKMLSAVGYLVLQQYHCKFTIAGETI